jgi:hypothetical protein
VLQIAEHPLQIFRVETLDMAILGDVDVVVPVQKLTRQSGRIDHPHRGDDEEYQRQEMPARGFVQNEIFHIAG